MKRWILPFLLLTLLLLTGCAGAAPAEENIAPVPAAADDTTPPQILTEGAEPLTTEEITRAREAFIPEYYDKASGWNVSTEISCFFTSRYGRAEDLSLAEFLRYYPDDELMHWDDTGDQAEFEALKHLEGFPFQTEEGFEPSLATIPTPTHRYPRAAVDATLQKYAGISTADLTNTEGILYLPEYDAYYNFTSDWGPGVFQPDGGEKLGDTVRFWTREGSGNVYTVLTLEKISGTWLIRSFRTEIID